jgi:hypothetical protein
MSCKKESQLFSIQIEDSGNQEENLKRFLLACFNRANSCFPKPISDLDLSDHVLCRKDDLSRVSNRK